MMKKPKFKKCLLTALAIATVALNVAPQVSVIAFGGQSNEVATVELLPDSNPLGRCISGAPSNIWFVNIATTTMFTHSTGTANLGTLGRGRHVVSAPGGVVNGRRQVGISGSSVNFWVNSSHLTNVPSC